MPKKIQKTNRIVITDKHCDVQTIYCSSEVVFQTRKYTIRLGQILHPRKDQRDDLAAELYRLAKELPEHFPSRSREIVLHQLSGFI